MNPLLACSALALACAALCPSSARAQEADEVLAGELRELVSEVREPDAPGGILGCLRRGELTFVQPFGL